MLSLSALSSFFNENGEIKSEAHFDRHLGDLEATLVLCGQDHTGSLLATFCEKTFGEQTYSVCLESMFKVKLEYELHAIISLTFTDVSSTVSSGGFCEHVLWS